MDVMIMADKRIKVVSLCVTNGSAYRWAEDDKMKCLSLCCCCCLTSGRKRWNNTLQIPDTMHSLSHFTPPATFILIYQQIYQVGKNNSQAKFVYKHIYQYLKKKGHKTTERCDNSAQCSVSKNMPLPPHPILPPRKTFNIQSLLEGRRNTFNSNFCAFFFFFPVI